MSETVSIVSLGDYTLLFVGDELVADGHTISPGDAVRAVIDTRIDAVRTIEVFPSDVDAVQGRGELQMYVTENGPSVVFDDD